MGGSAITTLYTADMQTDRSILRFDTAVIVAMNRKTSRMTTAAGQLMELKRGDCIIIKIL